MQKSFSEFWGVFWLFTIPVGGGIPAGVLLAKSRGIGWLVTTVLYFISDVCLACVFEPLMKLFIRAGKYWAPLGRFNEAMKRSTAKSAAKYGLNPGPFTLVMIAFGVDPMTGRAAAKAAGHGFVTGWLIAITGDMVFFGLLMASTLWLNNILGDGTLTAVVIMVAMMGVPAVIRKLRGKEAASN